MLERIATEAIERVRIDLNIDDSGLAAGNRILHDTPDLGGVLDTKPASAQSHARS